MYHYSGANLAEWRFRNGNFMASSGNNNTQTIGLGVINWM